MTIYYLDSLRGILRNDLKNIVQKLLVNQFVGASKAGYLSTSKKPVTHLLLKKMNLSASSLGMLMQEPSDQFLRYSSELVVIFLKFLYDQDPVRQLLDPSEVDHEVEVDLETMQKIRELVQFGGFSDCNYLQRTLLKEFQQMESRDLICLDSWLDFGDDLICLD
ncbi:hypothetical protein Q3G72_028261 [Acer saccharum]|nr:hypothetical protein Q3G72_028261 [Acer saccharum]